MERGERVGYMAGVKGKGKVHPRTGHEGPEGEWVVNAKNRPFYPREWPGTHCTGGWVGPRAGLDVLKISPPPGFEPRAAQLVASRYTGYSIPAHIWQGWPLNELGETRFRRKLRQEQCINKIIFPPYLVAYICSTTIGQFQLWNSFLDNLLKRRSRSASFACEVPEHYLYRQLAWAAPVTCANSIRLARRVVFTPDI
jgi:hypothetical protein